KFHFAAVLWIVALLWTTGTARGGDWPQILGPQRNGKAQDEHLAERWGADGPKVRWSLEVGQGFAGPAVVGHTLVLFHRVGDELVAAALNAQTGKPLWKRSFPTRFASGYSSDSGPRCVPLIDANRVFLFGPGGDLHCLAFDSGKVLWSRPVYQEFGAPEGYFGAGSSPLVEAGKLLLNVGGKSGAGLVAFSLEDGKTIWKS